MDLSHGNEDERSSSTSDQNRKNQIHPAQNLDETYHDPGSRTTIAPWEVDGHLHTFQTSSQSPSALEPPIPSTNFSARDEFAVQGLLALGTQPGFGDIPGAPDHAICLDNGLDLGSRFGPGPTHVSTGSAGGKKRRRGSESGSRSLGSPFMTNMQSVTTPAAHPFPNLSLESRSSGDGRSSTDTGISEMRKLKLLQYYRYSVAPWVRLRPYAGSIYVFHV